MPHQFLKNIKRNLSNGKSITKSEIRKLAIFYYYNREKFVEYNYDLETVIKTSDDDYIHIVFTDDLEKRKSERLNSDIVVKTNVILREIYLYKIHLFKTKWTT